MGKLLIYGATGAAGLRLAELAVADGLVPVVAGRNREALEAIAGRLGCEVRAATLEQLDTVMDGVAVVASCVGPYTHFGLPVLDAAVRAGASYLDLTGEPRYVARLLDEYDGPARKAGVTLVPSAGLGLCSSIAARAASAALPDNLERITIGYRPRGMVPSTGTLRSTVELVAGGAVVVEHGRARFVSPGRRVRRTEGGLGALFPLTDPLTMVTMWPTATIESYFLSRAAPALAGALLTIRLLGHGSFTKRVLRYAEGRIESRKTPGGGFEVTVAVHSATSTTVATVEIDDVYELTSQAALEVSRSLLNRDADPGVRASGAVVGDPADVANRIGVRLRIA
jgi:short subunit dehydrogenase-like uncharacterized protein